MIFDRDDDVPAPIDEPTATGPRDGQQVGHVHLRPPNLHARQPFGEPGNRVVTRIHDHAPVRIHKAPQLVSLYRGQPFAERTNLVPRALKHHARVAVDDERPAICVKDDRAAVRKALAVLKNRLHDQPPLAIP